MLELIANTVTYKWVGQWTTNNYCSEKFPQREAGVIPLSELMSEGSANEHYL